MHRVAWGDALSETRLAELLQVSPVTLRRWVRGTQAPPPYAVAYGRLLIAGELRALDPVWDGWTLRDGVLHSPGRLHFTPGELLLWPSLWRLARLRADKREPEQLELF